MELAMNSVKVLHTGDIHLGYDYGENKELKTDRTIEIEETFTRIIDMCLV